MSKPFVCTGCRVRLTLRSRYTAGLDISSQRRDFSRLASNDQTQTYSVNDGQARKSREQIRRQRIYEEGLSHLGAGCGQPSMGGRYSGQPLKPQHLLQELGDSRPPPQRQQRGFKPTHLRNGEVKRPNGTTTGRLIEAVKAFESHVAQSELVEAWNILQHMRSEIAGADGFYFAKSAIKKIHQLMRRVVVDYARNLGSGTGLPTPWEFVQTVKDLNALSPALRAELLWRLGNGLVMKLKVHGDVVPTKQAQALEQITLIWHDTLATKLLRGSPLQEQSSQDSILSWSFLPSPKSIARDEEGPRKNLIEALACIVPNGEYSFWSEAVVDYQSALFVTLDLLDVDADQTSPYQPSTTGNLSWSPMLVFFDDLLARIIKPSVPPAIQKRLEQSEDPSLSYYEAMVRRFGLANVPPIRTDRSKALSDKTIGRLDELGRPVPKGLERMSMTVTKKLEESNEPSSPLALDRASLLESGYSVSEDWDMDSDIHLKVDGWLKRLGRSIETSNLLITETCWTEVRQFTAKEGGAASLPLFLYEHLMLAFLALRQPRLAVEAWNAVTESGLQPTVKTWTVMMRGCSRANDPDTLEKFWTRMREQDIQPDQHSWSVRLFCLAKAGRISTVFSALQQMGQEWVAAVRAQQKVAIPPDKAKQRTVATLPPIDLTEWSSDVGNVPRPNLVIVNSVVSALASKADDQIPRVLAWAREFAIEFDLVTYNALLNVAMRHGRTAEAFSVIKHMESRSIQPNSTTITVILTALFQSDYFGRLPVEDQTTELLALISSIEASSPTATLDAKGYALAIDRMLKQHDNQDAARALLEHMSERGFKPTAHIYTILMTSYFQADPPNFAAAEALWARLQSNNSGYSDTLDTIFYDRMVEAYARHHDHYGTAPMMELLERMSREGKRPGWSVLEHVARALADRGDWGLLHGLVDDVRETRGLLRVGVRGLVGQNEFWRFVIGTGVLDRAGVTSEQEVRKNVGSSSFHGFKNGI
jgi:pentatricopeptide repeat protein